MSLVLAQNLLGQDWHRPDNNLLTCKCKVVRYSSCTPHLAGESTEMRAQPANRVLALSRHASIAFTNYLFRRSVMLGLSRPAEFLPYNVKRFSSLERGYRFSSSRPKGHTLTVTGIPSTYWSTNETGAHFEVYQQTGPRSCVIRIRIPV